MSLVINTNVSSLNTQNNLTKSQSALAQATQRLSSGLKINSAADNAAGFAISQRYTTQIGGLAQASANASDAINLAQTAGSALDQVTANLQAIRDLAAQSANGTYSDADRATIDNEVQQRLAEVTRIANQTTFNGKKVLDGSLQSQSFQIGANVGQTVSVSLGQSVKASSLGKVAEVKTGDISAASVGATAGTVRRQRRTAADFDRYQRRCVHRRRQRSHAQPPTDRLRRRWPATIQSQLDYGCGRHLHGQRERRRRADDRHHRDGRERGGPGHRRCRRYRQCQHGARRCTGVHRRCRHADLSGEGLSSTARRST